MASRLARDPVGLAAAGIVSGTALAALGAPVLAAGFASSTFPAFLRSRAALLASVACLLSFALFGVRTGGERAEVFDPLRRTRDAILEPLVGSVHGDAGALAAGLTLGDSSYFSPEARAAMRATATTHLVALSGFNVALLLGFARRTLSPRVRGARLAVLCCALLLAFVTLTGFQPSLVRAAAMGGAVLFAHALGRRVGHGRLLLVTAACMLALWPGFALHLGFTLSFAASWVLLATVGDVEKMLASGRSGMRAAIAAGFAPTAVAQLGVTPVLLATVGSTALIGFGVNAALAPVTWVLTAASWFQLLLSHVSLPLALVTGTAVALPLRAALWSIDLAASVPITVTASLPPVLVAATYAGWVLLSMKRRADLW